MNIIDITTKQKKRKETKKLIHFFVSTTIISIIGIIVCGIEIFFNTHKIYGYEFVIELIGKPIVYLMLLSVLSSLIITIKKSKDLQKIDADLFKNGS
jgi:uncharacterized Tic20 family protein